MSRVVSISLRSSARRPLWLCLSLFSVHLVLVLVLPQDALLLPSGIFMTFYAALATFACFRRAGRESGQARALWALTGCGESMLFACYIAVGIEFVFLHVPHNQTQPSDFLIYLWGLPILMAIASPSESRPSLVFYCLDALQIAFLLIFMGLFVFGSLPFLRLHGTPASGLESTVAYSSELLLMALFVTLRLASRPASLAVRHFWIAACVLLWAHTAFDTFFNFVNLYLPYPPTRLHILLAVSPLSLFLFATSRLTPEQQDEPLAAGRTLALLLDNGSPVLYPALVSVLAILSYGQHPRLAVSAIALSLAAYAIRSTLLQVRFQQVQRQMKHTQEQLERLTLTDPLTGIANRRNFDLRLNQAWTSGDPFFLLIVDVDFFKLLNDTYGHAEGDRCLRSIAFALQSTFRNDHDLVARFGGEEFAAILYVSDASSAIGVARRMLRAVDTLELRTQTPIGSTVTISIGIAASSGAASVSALIQNADKALYSAKQQGRNRVVFL